ncbi:MAG TPA: phosphoadenylyl-sulfate reductase [Dehalococcoidia bacterium]|nr:phosphoadenylyl-sulfate reductase [Dehalococcoidia bacterium]
MTITATARPDEAQLAALNARFAGAEPQELIAWAAAQYPGKLAISCSFGGPSGMALLDLALQVDRAMPVIYVDTDYLFPETYATVRAVESRYGITPLAFRSTLTPRTQELLHGPALWERDPDACCAMRKVAPMREALAHFSAYLTGLRRDQASTRRETPLVQWDAQFGVLKLNPLAAWSEAAVWAHIAMHNLPYNSLHDRGYPSIGCTNCTRAVQPGEDARAGRWSGSDKIECGLHVGNSG